MALTIPLNASGTTFHITHPKKDESGNFFQGRVLLFLSKNNLDEPRFQTSDKSSTAFVFGVDLKSKSATKTIIDNSAFGYPVRSLSEIPPGEYFIQGLLHKYEKFKLKTGHTVHLPMDRGEGQRWHSAPGNYYSKPEKISLDPKKRKSIKIVLDQVIPEIIPPSDTKYCLLYTSSEPTRPY